MVNIESGISPDSFCFTKIHRAKRYRKEIIMVIAMKNRMEQINMLLEQDGMEVSLQERFKNNQLK